jgi:hypothetical protein
MTEVHMLNVGGAAIPTQGAFEGTDLEIARNLQGEDLVLRVNKGGVLVFRAMLKEAVRPMLESRLVHFNSFAPDLAFTIGGSEEGLVRMLRAAGIMEHALPRRGWFSFLRRGS